MRRAGNFRLTICDLRLVIGRCWSASLLVACLTVPTPALSQGPLSVQREFVLSTPGLGVGNAIIELRAGGFAAVGYADLGTSTGTDAFFVRFDAAGDTLWTRSYGGEHEDFGWDVVEAVDGGFFIAGYTEAPTAGREDVLVLRLDAVGELLWERTLGGEGRDRAWSATLTTDGDIVIAGESERVGQGGRDAYLIRIGDDGEVRWANTVDAPGDQRVYHVARTTDGAFVSTGTTAPDGETNRDVYVIRITGDGSLGWTRSFGGAPDDVGHGVMGLAGGDVLVTGYDGSHSGGDRDVHLMRLASNGDLRWWHHDERPGEDRAMMSALRPGGYVTVGFSMAPTGFDMVILESDADGNEQTRTLLERPGNDRGVMILTAQTGEYVLAGTVDGSNSSPGDFAVLWLASGGSH